jgi:ethanolamine utilization protein EutP (predicted NTPase)
MLRIAFVGPTRAGKSSAINSLIGARSAPIGLSNTTKAVAEYSAKIDGTNCTLIDTPADYPLTKLPAADVVLYVVEVGNMDDAHWTKFRTYFAEFNKPKSVPVHIAILITKCDSHPTLPKSAPNASTSQIPPNILIAEDSSENADDLDNYYDQAIIDEINATTKKYSDACPVIPFNAFGRVAKYAMPVMAKAEGRKALSYGFTNLSVSQFYDSTATTAEFQGLRRIMNMTDTLTKDIEKYTSCIYCGSITTCNCCKDFSNQAPISDVYYRVNKGYHTPIVGQHFTVYKPVGCNGGIAKYCLYCLMYDDSARITPSMGPSCVPKEKNCVSKFRCRSGYRACTFNIAHPCGQIANKLAELYDNKSAPKLLKMAIIQFALNGQSQFGKSPNYNSEYWNIMATHLTFDRADLASFKPKTKDEAFRLLQFSRQKSIVEKIDLYCAALRLPAESPNSLAIKCANGEVGIFADRPIKNIAELKLVFNLIPTKRVNPSIETLFSDRGESYTYTAEILAELPAIVARINCHADYDELGLFT